MKRTFLSILLCMVLVLCLSGCKSKDNNPNTKSEQIAFNIITAIEQAYADYYNLINVEPTYNALSKQFNEDNPSIGAKMYYGVVSVENTNVKCNDTTDENSLYMVTCIANDTQKQYSTNKLKISTSR